MRERALQEATEALFSATIDPSVWTAVLGKVSDAVGGFDTHLFSWRVTGGGMSFSATGMRLPVEAEALYDQYYGAIDPRLGLVAHSKTGRWFSCEEAFDQNYVSRSEFFSDFLIPMGARYLYGVKLLEDSREAAFLGFHRSSAMGGFDAASMRDARRLAQMIDAAFRVRQRIADLNSELARHRVLLDRLPWAIFAVSEDAGVRYANKQGEEILRRGDALKLVFGRLSSNDDAVTASIRSIVRQAYTAKAAEYLNAIRSVERIRTSVGDYLITIAPLQAAATPAIPAIAREVIVIVSDPVLSARREVEALRGAFGLTVTEARVARLLATGMRPEQVAAELGIRVQTVKTHLRAIFEKTGTSRQSELVRTILLMPSVV